MFDLIVLGGGPAGYVGAVRAAQLGAKVALVEQDRLGGTCLNRGCIPTKALVESARLFARRNEFAHFGLKASGFTFDLSAAVKRKDGVVNGLVRGLESLMRSYGVTVFKGHGRVVKPGQVAVGDTLVEAPHILLATGSRVSVPPIPGSDLPGVITSDQVLDLIEQPSRLVIIGGGVIGVEIAGMFAAADTQVTIVEALPRILPTADNELVELMVRELKRSNVTVTAGAKVERIEGTPGQMKVHLAGAAPVEGDLVLIATGRRPNLEGLEALNLTLDRGAVVTDEHMLTNVPGVAAAGDIVAGRPMLAHVAYHEAKVAVENLLGHEARMDYRVVPGCIFGPLDLAQVGLTEQEAAAQGYDVQVGRFPMPASGRAQTLGETVGLIKVISDKRYGEVLGVHMLGAHVSELLGEATLAIAMEATLDELSETIHMHPTLSEGIHEAALETLGLALHLPKPRAR